MATQQPWWKKEQLWFSVLGFLLPLVNSTVFKGKIPIEYLGMAEAVAISLICGESFHDAMAHLAASKSDQTPKAGAP